VDRRIPPAFLLLILAQAAHSIEQRAAGLYEVFVRRPASLAGW